ncbi:hypothetical protein [Symbiopectobacterium sp. RP]|uniref:hypothetical protein n=1 Tax=Symbiopectobacterium sp. RP TaxID=3248553 RepID=UPI003D2DB59A
MITANALICGKKIQLIVIKIMSLGYISPKQRRGGIKTFSQPAKPVQKQNKRKPANRHKRSMPPRMPFCLNKPWVKHARRRQRRLMMSYGGSVRNESRNSGGCFGAGGLW